MKQQHIFGIITLCAVVVLSVVFSIYGKWDETYWGIPVILFAVGSAVITYLAFGQLRYFREVRSRSGSSNRAFVIAGLGLIACILGGIYSTEPVQDQGWQNARSVSSTGSDYNYGHSRVGYWYHHSNFYSGSSEGSSSGGDFSGFDDVDGEAMMILVVAVFVIVLIIATLLIPHFWMISTLCIITLMLMLALRESRVGKPDPWFS